MVSNLVPSHPDKLSALDIIYVVHVYGMCIEDKDILCLCLPPSPFSPKADLIFRWEEGYSTLPGKEQLGTELGL